MEVPNELNEQLKDKSVNVEVDDIVVKSNLDSSQGDEINLLKTCTSIVQEQLNITSNVKQFRIINSTDINNCQQLVDSATSSNIGLENCNYSAPTGSPKPSLENNAENKVFESLSNLGDNSYHPDNNLNNVELIKNISGSTPSNLDKVSNKKSNIESNDVSMMMAGLTAIDSSLSQLVDYSDTDTDETSATSEFSGSDNEDDSNVECDIIPTDPIGFQNDKFRDVEISETSSDSDTSSSTSSIWDSDDDDDVAIVEVVKSTKEKDREKENIPRTKGEMRLCDLPPIEDLHISVPSQECIELGSVSSIVDELVIIQALPNLPPLDIDTILFIKEGEESLGKVFDVFGPINEPCYAVRFNKKDDILSRGITRGTKVFCAPRTEHTSYVMVSDLMKIKGSDASWREDNEPPANCVEYSDDEEERRAKNKKGNKNVLPCVREQQIDKQCQRSLSDFEKRMNRRNLQLSAQFTPDNNCPSSSNNTDPQFSLWTPSRHAFPDSPGFHFNIPHRHRNADPVFRNRSPMQFHPYIEPPNVHNSAAFHHRMMHQNLQMRQGYNMGLLRAPVFRPHDITYQNMNIPPPPLPFAYVQGTVLPSHPPTTGPLPPFQPPNFQGPISDPPFPPPTI